MGSPEPFAPFRAEIAVEGSLAIGQPDVGSAGPRLHARNAGGALAVAARRLGKAERRYGGPGEGGATVAGQVRIDVERPVPGGDITSSTQALLVPSFVEGRDIRKRSALCHLIASRRSPSPTWRSQFAGQPIERRVR